MPSGCCFVWEHTVCSPMYVWMDVDGRVFLHSHVLGFFFLQVFPVLFCVIWCSCLPEPSLPHQPLHHFPFAAPPPPCPVQPFSPLFTSLVYEIRWFLLGEASVHPSAAPSCPCPTPSIQVISKPANSHSLSLHNLLLHFNIYFLCISLSTCSARSMPWQAQLSI